MRFRFQSFYTQLIPVITLPASGTGCFILSHIFNLKIVVLYMIHKKTHKKRTPKTPTVENMSCLFCEDKKANRNDLLLS